MRALVTGASSGIGRATAAALVALGHSALGTSRDPGRRAPADRVPGMEYAALDLTDPAAVEAFAGRLADVDVLVDNAGEGRSGPLEELPAEALERLFRLDVLALVRLTQLALPGMRARGHGRVVMVGSMLVTTVEPGSVSTGIGQRRTTYVADGSPYVDDVATMLAVLDRNEAAGIPAERVAATILRAVEAGQPRPLYAVGSRAPVVFALRRVLPRATVLRMVARRHGLRR